MVDKKMLPATQEEVATLLSDLRTKRGYLLPHHGLLAVSEPSLLTAYDDMYTALTLEQRSLPEREKEIIWLAVLVSTGEAIATHHIDRLLKCGGTEEDLLAALALAAWAEGAPYYAFVGRHWKPHLKEFKTESVYRRGLSALVAVHPIKDTTAEIALAAVHTCHRRWDWVKSHIIGAYAAGAEEGELAEGLSLTMFPGGVPNFVDACEIWRQLILDGALEASSRFRAWATLSGQGGFDEAAGISS